MATHASAEKASRQAVKRAARNQMTKSKFKSAVKKLRTAMATKYESKAAAQKQLAPLMDEVQRVLMRSASKNIIKKKTASRQISRLNMAINRVTA
jgi:small subunit ribosomal protein S20